MKLLLAEDEKRMAQALIQILKLENYEVDYFEDGLSALEAAESGMYDIIVLDVMLPIMSGFEI
ncbi:MAG: response regulator, partial [Clostridia bacterium]|nr:response regulator [Clostridia bacterium]